MTKSYYLPADDSGRFEADDKHQTARERYDEAAHIE
ncbi:hypothetical protein MY10362_009101, partial [Beauveria mimosiformis]